MFLQDSKKLLRRIGLNAEAVCSHEVPLIVSDNGLAACCYRQFQNHVVLGVRKIGTPQEEDVLSMCDLTQVVQEDVDVLLGEKTSIQVPSQHILVLEKKRH